MNMLSVLLLLLFPLLAWADTLYKSVGPDGTVVYSDKPLAGGQVEKTLEYTPGPSSPLPDYVLRYKEELEKQAKQRAVGAQRTDDTPQLFTASWCGFCRKAKAYLAGKAISYTEHDIETPDGMAALVSIGGGRGVPILTWRGKRVQGFSEANYDAFFR
ncbi:MAG: glutaredoxin family protein [Candidatus Contendobacter sp.]|nr:glutaredoxin family protein [Candidatus Contendobacter sp.]MDG4558403.1 glutaredoxin family protein [Candidatus Contendobacter sp.]